MNYPTLEAVQCADVNQLISWHETLPAPQADVEHTVRRRLKKRLDAIVAAEVRGKAPGVAESWNKVMAQAEKVMGLKPGTYSRM